MYVGRVVHYVVSVLMLVGDRVLVTVCTFGRCCLLS